jgi:hypothetical protein
MTQGSNLYVIVNRIGTRPVTQWTPDAASPASLLTSRTPSEKFQIAAPLSFERELNADVEA